MIKSTNYFPEQFPLQFLLWKSLPTLISLPVLCTSIYPYMKSYISQIFPSMCTWRIKIDNLHIKRLFLMFIWKPSSQRTASVVQPSALLNTHKPCLQTAVFSNTGPPSEHPGPEASSHWEIRTDRRYRSRIKRCTRQDQEWQLCLLTQYVLTPQNFQTLTQATWRSLAPTPTPTHPLCLPLYSCVSSMSLSQHILIRPKHSKRPLCKASSAPRVKGPSLHRTACSEEGWSDCCQLDALTYIPPTAGCLGQKVTVSAQPIYVSKRKCHILKQRF